MLVPEVTRIMSAMKGKRSKRWKEMNARELAASTAEFEGPVIERTRPMNAAERGRWKAARRRGRVGRGSKAVSVTIEVGLLERADRTAKRLGLTRAQLIARGLVEVLGAG